MTKYLCPKCDQDCKSTQGLSKHLAKKFRCDRDPSFRCKHCAKGFTFRQSRDFHQKSCAGPKVTIEQQQKRIETLETVVAAIGGTASSSHVGSTINNDNRTIINNEHVNNIQNNNITVFVAGQENIDYIKALTLEELKREIGSSPDPNLIMNFFKLRRINEEHPENHSLLLPDVEGKSIHYKDKDGWKETSYDEKMRGLLHGDNLDLQSRFNEHQQETHYNLYWGYLVHDLMTKCTRMDFDGLKPILDGLRGPLHDLTTRLAAENTTNDWSNDNQDVEDIDEDLLQEQALDLQSQLIMVQQQQVQAKLNKIKKKAK